MPTGDGRVALVELQNTARSGVSLLSGLVTKCPLRVQHLASHIIGYVKETLGL